MSEHRAFAAALRELADFIESDERIPLPSNLMVNVFCRSREELADVARAASWQKEYNDVWFMLRRTFGGERVIFDVNTERSEVCRKVVTGSVVVPAKPAVPEHVEETFEWVCDDVALLAGGTR